jgi:flavodoxin I
MTTAQTINDKLVAKGHAITMKEARDTTPDDFNAPQAILLGSPSWDFEGKEGMPHEDWIPLMEKLKTTTQENKPFAVFGLGDSSYKHFCSAVDHLEELVKTMKGKLIVPALRIDKFYSDQTGNMDKINKWADDVIAALG